MVEVVGTEGEENASGRGLSKTAAGDASSILRRARASARMTQRHLAAAAGVSERTVSRAERGDSVAAESVRALCAVLGLDAAALPAPKEAGQDAGSGSEEGFSAPPSGSFWRAAAACGAFSKRTSGASGRTTSAALAAGMAFGASALAASACILASGRPAEASIGAAVGACFVLAFLSDRLWRRCGLYGPGVPDWLAGALGWICWCALAGPLGLASWGAFSLAAR